MEFPLRVGIFSTGHIKQKDNNFGLFGDQAISIKTQENIHGNKATRLFLQCLYTKEPREVITMVKTIAQAHLLVKKVQLARFFLVTR